jgi:Ureidoglycolate hydrolase
LIALGEVSDFIVVDRGGDGLNLHEQDLAESLWLTEDALSTVVI